MSHPSPPLTWNECIKRANAAVTRKDLPTAVAWAKEATVNGGEQNWKVWNFLGTLQEKAGLAEDAAASLRQAVKLRPTVEALTALAKLEAGRQAWSEAEAYLAQAQTLEPSNALVPTMRGDFFLQQKRNREAGECYKAALVLAPENVTLLRAASQLLWPFVPDEVFLILQAYIRNPKTAPSEKAFALWTLAPLQERRERLARGLWPCHGATVADIGFHFVEDVVAEWHRLAKAVVENNPRSWEGLNLLAQSYLALRQPLAAEPYLALLRGMKTGGISDAIFLDPDFHAALNTTTESTISRLMPSSTVLENGPLAGETIFFVGCDYRYALKHTRAQLRSLAQHGTDIPICLHIFDATADEVSSLLAFTREVGLRAQISYDWVGLREPDSAKPTSKKARSYYHIARYMRLFQFLEQHPRKQVYLLDADVLFIRRPGELFERLAGCDVTMVLAPGRVEYQNQFSACVVGVAPHAAARDYFRRVAGYLAHCLTHDLMPWGLDQVALYAVYAAMAAGGAAPDVAGLPPHIYDGGFGDDTILWPSKSSDGDPDAAKLAAYLAALR